MADDLVAEVQALNVEVSSLSSDVKSLRDVQEQRRLETLAIAEDLRKETGDIAEKQRLDTKTIAEKQLLEERRRTWVIAGCLALGILAVFITVVVFGLIIVDRLQDNAAVARSNTAAIAENNTKFCDLVGQSAGSTPPPTTPRGKSLQKSAMELYKNLGCR